MAEQVRVVIIGGGIVGCSVLYALAKQGWTDTLLLEKRNLTSGSTWHAAGNVTYFGHYASITRLYTSSIKNYLEAEQESGLSIGFHSTGSFRIANSKDELAAYRRLAPMYQQLNIRYRIVRPETVVEIHPLLDVSEIAGAAYTPDDGHVDPVGATMALASAARKRGAVIRTQSRVEHITKQRNGRWRVICETGEVEAEHVVLATSFWTRELAMQLDLNLPLFALEHHELITGEVSKLRRLDYEVPTVRDPYCPSNIRQEGYGFLCGVYESQPAPWSVEGIPMDFTEQLLAPDIERLLPHLEKVMQRMPALADAGIKQVNNGPICYTPDGCPMLGPVGSRPGIWLATGYAVGIGTGGGSGEFLADWMVNKLPPYPLPVVYPSRFGNELEKERAIEQIIATYAAGYPNPE